MILSCGIVVLHALHLIMCQIRNHYFAVDLIRLCIILLLHLFPPLFLLFLDWILWLILLYAYLVQDGKLNFVQHLLLVCHSQPLDDVGQDAFAIDGFVALVFHFLCGATSIQCLLAFLVGSIDLNQARNDLVCDVFG